MVSESPAKTALKAVIDAPPRPDRRPAAHEHVSWIAVLRALRKHWPAAAACATLVMVAVAVYTLGSTKIYRASATVEVDPTPPKPLGKEVQTVVDMGAGDYFANHEYLETQYKIIQSKRVALAVVRQMGLQHDVSFIRDVPPRSGIPGDGVSENQAAEILRDRLSVEPVKESRLAFVKYDDASPERAQRILSAVIDTYISQNLDDNLASLNSAEDWLRLQLDRLKGELETSEMALHEFKEQKNLLALEVDDQSNTLREQLRLLSTQLIAVSGRREELAAKVAELLKEPDNDPRSLGAPELLGNPLLSSLRERYEDAVRERDQLLGQGKGQDHPDVLRAQAGVLATRDGVIAEIRNIRVSAQRELASVAREEAGILALMKQAQGRAVEANLLEIQYNRLNRSRENNDKLYTMVLERATETDLQRLLRVNNLHVVDAPDLADRPVRPRVALMILVALLAGLGSGIGVAVSLVALDRTVKTPENVEGELGIPCLGLLPILESRSRAGGRRQKHPGRGSQNIIPELVVHQAPMSNVAEAARAIRTNLMFMSTDDPIRTLLVTSANPGEGKTTVACCIATAIAHAGHRTLLVDCDLRRPRIHRVFGMASDVGLTTALLDASAVDTAIQATEVPNLFVLPAGALPPNPADLMHSERFRALIADLRSRFDRVVIDSSPIGAVTDATILSAYVDATMLVVRAFITKKDAARHALRAVLDIGSKTAGVVLNAVDFSKMEYKYASYYGRYGYGYGHVYGQNQATVDGANGGHKPSSEQVPPPDRPSAAA